MAGIILSTPAHMFQMKKRSHNELKVSCLKSLNAKFVFL